MNKKLMLVLGALFIPLIYLYAQQKPEQLTEKTVSVNYNQVKLGEVLTDLQNQYGFEFSYITDQLPLDKKVTVFAKDKKATELFDLLFTPIDIEYHLVKNKIILKRKNNAKVKEQPSTVTISGFVKEKGSLESLPGAAIYIPSLQRGTVSNNYGFYSITLPVGDYEIEFSFVGFSKSIRKLSAQSDIRFDIELEASNVLKEVVVSGNKESQKITETTQMSSTSIPISQIKDVPSLLGEKDVFKVLQLLPGVQKATEGASGFHVRGGTPDQNLIILDDAVVYNANHLFGFFSIFNGDALKSVELFKGGFPARFGERLSSVTVVNMKDGNKEKFQGEAGIGLISSRLTLEGPVKKGKSSFLVSGRRTYIDLLMRPTQDANKYGGYYFYDFNAKYSAYINDRNRLYLSGYFGRDVAYSFAGEDKVKDEGELSWGNATLSARWNHIFGKRLFSNTSLIYSNYNFGATYNRLRPDYSDDQKYKSSITDIGGKFDVDYSLSSSHFLRAGIRSVVHMFKPFILTYSNSDPNISSISKEATNNSLESNLFIEDDWKVNERLSLNIGVRTTAFLTNDSPAYWNVEPRLAGKYMIGNDLALKASYARMNQYIHLLSSTGINLPTEKWVPSTQNIRPQQSDQIALGLAKDIVEKNLTVSLEGYYKKINNIISYKEGTSFFNVGGTSSQSTSSQVNLWENDITVGKGNSRGVELLIQRKTGKLSGWVGYTLSWTKYQFDELNFGKEFAPKQDRRHDFSLVGIYQPSPRHKFSLTWVYSSGSPMQVGRAQYPIRTEGPIQAYGLESTNNPNSAVDYGERGSYISEAYHRLDLSAQFIKKKIRGERVWEFSLYNAYGQLNPFHYFTKNVAPEGASFTDNRLYKGSLFSFLPSISYIRKF